MERDPALRHFEHDGLLVWGGLTAAALLLTGGRWDVAVGVAAGGALMAVSYVGIKAGADLLVAAAGGARPTRRALVAGALKFLGRFALLGLAAYVMLTRFRLHPVGVLVGASTPLLSAAIQAGRLARRGMRPGTRD